MWLAPKGGAMTPLTTTYSPLMRSRFLTCIRGVIPRTEIESGQTREIILTAFGASSSSERYHLIVTSTGVTEVDPPGKCGSNY